MTATIESPASKVKTAAFAISRGLRALLTEHSRSLAAATEAALPRKRLPELRAMYTERREDPDTPIQGQLLRRSDRREVAIYLRKNALWVADFIDGQGEIVDAATWFRFNCGTPAASSARRRMARESAIPLSAQLVAKIESLHRSDIAAG